MASTAAKAKMAVKVEIVSMEKAAMVGKEGMAGSAAGKVVTEEMQSKEYCQNPPCLCTNYQGGNFEGLGHCQEFR